MTNAFNPEEQEQLDQIKHFWQRYGHFITWVLIAVLAVVAGHNAYQYWQRRQAVQAAALYDNLEQALKSADAKKTTQVWADMQKRVGSTAAAAQAGLLVAKALYEQGDSPGAKSALVWVAEYGRDDSLKALARLRLAGLFLAEKAYSAALAQLSQPLPAGFKPLVADRRGDVLHAQGKTQEARLAYEEAYRELPASTPYRRLVGAKLDALGTTVTIQEQP